MQPWKIRLRTYLTGTWHYRWIGMGVAWAVCIIGWLGVASSAVAHPGVGIVMDRQGNVFSARFAPDGETIVYGASWDGNPKELFTARAGSPESRSLDLPPAEILSISPSGEMALLLEPRFTQAWQRSGTLARAPMAEIGRAHV